MSVVVPAFQAEATLAATLSSLRRQTQTDIEIVVVDDGSGDRTREIALAAADADGRVRLFSQENRGLAGARNTGIRLSRADLVGFCDADDLWAPGKAAAHLAFMSSRPDVGVSFAGSVAIDDDGLPLGQVQRPRPDPVSVPDLLCGNPLGNGSTAVISKACLKDVAFCGPALDGRRICWFDESYRRSEDVELWCRIALTPWKIAGLTAPLTGYRVRGRGVSLSSDAKAQVESWRRMLRTLPAEATKGAEAGLAHQWRWQARKSVFAGDGAAALGAMLRAFAAGGAMRDLGKTAQTLAAAAALLVGGRAVHGALLRRMRSGGVAADAAWVLDYASGPPRTEPAEAAAVTSAST